MLNSVIHCVQEMEMQRRLALEKRLAEEEKKDSLKKKKKIHFWFLKYVQGAAKKSSPLIFFAVFSATAWNLNAKFYTHV